MNDIHSIPLSDLDNSYQVLQHTYYSGKTKSYEYRMNQLKKFYNMIMNEKDNIYEALYKDLHKASFETYTTELVPLLSEIQYFIDNLKDLMKIKYTEHDIVATPGTCQIQYEPLGLILIMGAWNYPINLTLIPLVGAIAAGNVVLIKPARYTTSTSNIISYLIKQYLDNSAYMVIEGDRTVTTAILEYKWNKIFFTGGLYVGKIIAQAAAKYLTPVVLEMGGKSPCIIDQHVNLKIAVNRIVWGKFTNTGQTCLAPDHILVHENIADEFINLLISTIIKFYSKDAYKSKWYGRIINVRAKERLLTLMSENERYLIYGGEGLTEEEEDDLEEEALEEHKHNVSLYISPSVYDFKSNLNEFLSSSLMSDELFGPLLPIFRYKNPEQVIHICQQREKLNWKPLVLYCFSSDYKFINYIQQHTTSGGFSVNDCLIHMVQPGLPFGGVGNSGMGSYHLQASFKTFSHAKSCLIRPALFDISCRYPPYTKSKQYQIKFIVQILLMSKWKKKTIFKFLFQFFIIIQIYQFLKKKKKIFFKIFFFKLK